MHGEEFIADNMIKVVYTVISVEWRSAADRSRYKLKGEIKFLLCFFFFFFFCFVFLFFCFLFCFWTKSAHKNNFSGYMHNFFLL